MDLERIRLQTRTIIFSIAGVLSFIIFLGTLVDIGGAPSNFIFDFFSFTAKLLSSPFEGAFLGTEENILKQVHLDAVLVIGFYFFLAFVISEFVTGFFYDKVSEILKNVTDGIIKILELLIFLRILLDIFGAWSRESLPSFVDFVYSVTNWSSGFFLPIVVGSMRINISSILILVLLIILDLFVERFLQSLFEGIGNLLGAAAGLDFKLPRLKKDRKDSHNDT